ncbi:ovoinhibitor-like [Patiria miniata]|uniref:Kazal-like domain-containing protein n=1 Tax=Patiria miniata TaxID=46514 RepID=A0A914A2N5_PATMI|nr:ovoinhibitor-like [Patiria miniata]
MRPFVLLIGIAIAVFLLTDFCTALPLEPMEYPGFCEGMHPLACPRNLDPQCTIDGSVYANKCLLCGAILYGEQPQDVPFEPCDRE